MIVCVCACIKIISNVFIMDNIKSDMRVLVALGKYQNVCCIYTALIWHTKRFLRKGDLIIHARTISAPILYYLRSLLLLDLLFRNKTSHFVLYSAQIYIYIPAFHALSIYLYVRNVRNNVLKRHEIRKRHITTVFGCKIAT